MAIHSSTSSGATERAGKGTSSPALQVIVCGIGGQGVLTLGNRLVTLLSGHHPDVFSQEIRGIARKRAGVGCLIRCGDGIRSGFFLHRQADYLLALDALEAMQWMTHVGPATTCVVLDTVRAAPDTGSAAWQAVAARLAPRAGSVHRLAAQDGGTSQGLTPPQAADLMAGAFAALAGYPATAVQAVCAPAPSAPPARRHPGGIAAGSNVVFGVEPARRDTCPA